MGIKSTDLLPKINAEGVGTTPKSNLRTDTDMFGGRQGKDLADAGKGMMDVSAQLDAYAKKKADAADLTNRLEIDEGLQQLELDLETQSAERIGKDSKGWAKDAAKFTDKAIQKLRSKREFNSPEEAARADTRLKSMSMRFKAQAEMKEVKRTREYNGVMLGKQLEGYVNSGALNWDNDKAMTRGLGQIETTLKEVYENGHLDSSKGKDGKPSAFDVELQEKQSDYIAKGIVGALAEVDPDSLEISVDIYNEGVAGGQLTGDKKNAARKLIMDSGVETAAQELRDDVREFFPGDLKAQIKYIQDWEDGIMETEGLKSLLEINKLDRLPGDLAEKDADKIQKKEDQAAKDVKEGLPNEAQGIVDTAYVEGDITATKKAIDEATKGNQNLRKEAYTQAEAKHKAEGETKKGEQADALKDAQVDAIDDPKQALEAYQAIKGEEGTLTEKTARVNANKKLEAAVKILTIAHLEKEEKQRVAQNKVDDAKRFDDLATRAEGWKNGDPEITSVDKNGLDSREKTYIDKKIDEAKNPHEKRTGDGGKTLTAYSEVAGAGKFKDMTLREVKVAYEMGVTKEEWDYIQKHWVALNEADDKTGTVKKGPSGMAELQRVKNAAEKLGISLAKNSKKFTEFQIEYDNAVRDEKAVSVEHKAKILDWLVKETGKEIQTVKGKYWFDSHEKVRNMDDGDKADLAERLGMKGQEAIDFAESWNNLIGRLRKDGKEINDKNINDQWAKRKK
jgi:hypothetical protein